MENHFGEPSFPVWLLGDSPPKNFADRLAHPFDSRHPAVHNIWTPIIHNVQTELFNHRLCVNTASIYITNAADDLNGKPAKKVSWPAGLCERADRFGELVKQHNPVMIFTFGAFAYAFACVALNGSKNSEPIVLPNTKILGDEFRKRLASFKSDAANVIPLLHCSIARGNFLSGHRNFCPPGKNNYFYYTAGEIVRVILANKGQLKQILREG